MMYGCYVYTSLIVKKSLNKRIKENLIITSLMTTFQWNITKIAVLSVERDRSYLTRTQGVERFRIFLF